MSLRWIEIKERAMVQYSRINTTIILAMIVFTRYHERVKMLVAIVK